MTFALFKPLLLISPHPSCYHPYFTFYRENRSHQMRTLSASHLHPTHVPTFSSFPLAMLEEVSVLSKHVLSQEFYPFSSGFFKDDIPLDFPFPASSIFSSIMGNPINAQICSSIILKQNNNPALFPVFLLTLTQVFLPS